MNSCINVFREISCKNTKYIYTRLIKFFQTFAHCTPNIKKPLLHSHDQ